MCRCRAEDEAWHSHYFRKAFWIWLHAERFSKDKDGRCYEYLRHRLDIILLRMYKLADDVCLFFESCLTLNAKMLVIIIVPFESCSISFLQKTRLEVRTITVVWSSIWSQDCHLVARFWTLFLVQITDI